MAQAKKDNRSTRSDRQFVRSLWRHLHRVSIHDAAASTLAETSNRSPQQIVNDGPNGAIALGIAKTMNRLADLYFYWTGRPIS